MSQAGAVLLGAVAGGTVFLGLPVARMHGLPKAVQGFLNAFATGILVFLLWDILTHAAVPVEAAIVQGQRGPFAAMAATFDTATPRPAPARSRSRSPPGSACTTSPRAWRSANQHMWARSHSRACW